jgi:hypothetical protein
MAKKEKYTTVAAPRIERATTNIFASITIEDLKENREQVIAIITAHTTEVAKVMSYMVANIDNAGNCVEEFTTTCLWDLGLHKITDNSDIYAAAALRQRGSSMR